MSTTTPNLNLIQPSKSEKGGWTTYTTNNQTIDTAYGSYLNDREQSLENIAPIEGNTASTNYAVGKYLVKDGGLYKVTTAIASGETITEGVNVVATSLNDAVVDLNTAVATIQDSLSRNDPVMLLAWGAYETIGGEWNLSDSVFNYREIFVRFGYNTNLAQGGGQYYIRIPVFKNPPDVSLTTIVNDQFGILYNQNGTTMQATITFTSETKIKLLYGTNGSTMRSVFGIK